MEVPTLVAKKYPKHTLAALSWISNVQLFRVSWMRKTHLLSSAAHERAVVDCRLSSSRDFDANLYLCEEAFGALPLDTLERLSATLVLGPYALTLTLMGGALALAALRNLRWVHPKELDRSPCLWTQLECSTLHCHPLTV